MAFTCVGAPLRRKDIRNYTPKPANELAKYDILAKSSIP
jgi:hypothetical protein